VPSGVTHWGTRTSAEASRADVLGGLLASSVLMYGGKIKIKKIKKIKLSIE